MLNYYCILFSRTGFTQHGALGAIGDFVRHLFLNSYYATKYYLKKPQSFKLSTGSSISFLVFKIFQIKNEVLKKKFLYF